MPFHDRWQTHNIQDALTVRRVVFLSGPRQSGKTTVAKTLISPTVSYVTLDDPTIRKAAATDPHAFIQHRASQCSTLIIDEIQRVPDLLISIKQVVDDNTRPGQYLLTGSANIQSIPSVRESLAGRITKIRLKTLSQGEIHGIRPQFLERAFNQDFNYIHAPLTKQQVIGMAAAGGFPEALSLPSHNRKRWHLDYIEALLERDLKDITHIKKHATMGRLVEVLAAWSSKYMDIASICSGLSVGRETLESYIHGLQSLYLIEQVPAWRKTDYERVGKKPKIFMADSGLMFSLLSWSLEKIPYQPDPLGKLIETFGFNEISSQVEVSNGVYSLFHYRDREQREIDLLVEREDQSLLGIEIKSSSVATQHDFKHLLWFQENMAKQKLFIGIVLYTGEHVVCFGKNLWAVPFSFLCSPPL